MKEKSLGDELLGSVPKRQGEIDGFVTNSSPKEASEPLTPPSGDSTLQLLIIDFMKFILFFFSSI